MIRSLLVCTDGSGYGDTACDVALYLAGKLRAKLAGLHVMDARALEGPLLADVSAWIGAQPFGSYSQPFRALMEEKGGAILKAFSDKAAAQGLEAETLLRYGHPAQVILDTEPTAELVILGRQGEHDRLIGDMLGSCVDRVVRGTARPCLVTPASFQPLDGVVAAFDGSRHAGQALHEAIELAQALAAPLRLVAVTEPGGDPDDARRQLEEGLELVRAHDYEADTVVEEGRASERILAAAAEAFAHPLVVAGSHGHGRLRDMILGSTASRLLDRGELPLMLVR